MESAVEHPSPSCPRCGYDQTGAVAAWDRAQPASCPLEGQCTECGLTFWWRDLLNPVYSVQQRFFEHAGRRLATSLLLTTWRALRPRRFWTWVRMEHIVRPARMAHGAWAGAVLVYLAAAAVVFVLCSAQLLVLWMAGYLNGVPSEFAPWALKTALWPLRHDEYVPWSLMGRGPLHSWGVVSLVAVAAMPVVFLVLPDTLRQAKVRKIHLVRIGAYSLVGLPLVMAAGTAVHLILQVLRWSFGWQARYDGGEWLWDLDRAIMGHGRFSALVLVCLWLALWWGRAASLYLRLPRPYACTAAVLAIAALLTLIVGFVIPGLGAAVFFEW